MAGQFASLEGVLRFRDDRTGSLVELALSPSVPLRVCVDGASCGAESGLRGVRVLLVADVLFRIAELSGLQVVTVLATAGAPPASSSRPSPRLTCTRWPWLAAPGRPISAGRAGPRARRGERGRTGDGGDEVVIGVGPADDLTPDGRAAPPGAYGGTAGDPLALRLALLRRPYRQTVRLTEAVLAEAVDTVSRWRHAVAKWAAEPSRPIPAETAHGISVAFDNDLDTVAALDVLVNLESDGEAPAGAKFETFAFADRVLGLELVREIGR